nr:killing trait protein [Cystobacter sp.]
MTKSAQDFARELTLIVDASAHALTTLNRVLEQQQQSILALASQGGVPTPNVPRPAESAAPAASTVPATAAPPQAPAPAALSPEALLAQAEKSAQTLIEIAPGFAIAQVLQASAHAVSLALMNTATAQQQLAIVAQAVVTRGAANQLISR